MGVEEGRKALARCEGKSEWRRTSCVTSLNHLKDYKWCEVFVNQTSEMFAKNEKKTSWNLLIDILKSHCEQPIPPTSFFGRLGFGD